MLKSLLWLINRYPRDEAFLPFCANGINELLTIAQRPDGNPLRSNALGQRLTG
jgi:hypothetical protein